MTTAKQCRSELGYLIWLSLQKGGRFEAKRGLNKYFEDARKRGEVVLTLGKESPHPFPPQDPYMDPEVQELLNDVDQLLC